jgi:hypothetical protein
MYQVKVLGGFHGSCFAGYCCWVVVLCIIIWWICTELLEESATSIMRIEPIEVSVSCHILFFLIHGAIFYSEVNATFSSLIQLDAFSVYPHAKVNGNVRVVVKVRHELSDVPCPLCVNVMKFVHGWVRVDGWLISSWIVSFLIYPYLISVSSTGFHICHKLLP